jgi:hypothetical protein
MRSGSCSGLRNFWTDLRNDAAAEPVVLPWVKRLNSFRRGRNHRPNGTTWPRGPTGIVVFPGTTPRRGPTSTWLRTSGTAASAATLRSHGTARDASSGATSTCCCGGRRARTGVGLATGLESNFDFFQLTSNLSGDRVVHVTGDQPSVFTSRPMSEARRPQGAVPGTFHRLGLDSFASSYLDTKWSNPVEIRATKQTGSGRGGGTN